MATRPRLSTPQRVPTLISLPVRRRSPAVELGRRMALAVGLLLLSTTIVYLDRGSYRDNVTGDPISLIDALYYSTVTMTTTGYGDITPVSQAARILNAVLVTPLRVAFLFLLVGTTLEVLANQGRRIMADTRWRRHMRNHVIIVGFGTKGRSALETLRRNGITDDRIVVVDASPKMVEEANMDGLVALEGDATRRELLRRAEIFRAKQLIITMDRDDSAILTTLTARQLNPKIHIVVSVREEENAPLLRQSGADAVHTSSDTVGRLLGLSTVNPHLGAVIEDLLSSGQGLEIAQRLATPTEMGRSPLDVSGEQVIGVVRAAVLRRFYDPSVAELRPGDELIVIRRAPEAPTRG